MSNYNITQMSSGASVLYKDLEKPGLSLSNSTEDKNLAFSFPLCLLQNLVSLWFLLLAFVPHVFPVAPDQQSLSPLTE